MKKTLALVLFTALTLTTTAQRSTAFWEFGAFIGGLNYKGEITQEGDLGTWINEMQPEVGLHLKRNFNSRISLGAETSWGRFYASDKNHNTPDRAFVANTNLVQANLVFELNFKQFGKYFKRNQNTPFVKVGFGALAYAPTLNTNASYPPEYELYHGTFTTFNFQAAFGWKWRVSNHSIVGINIHWHATGASNLEGFDLKDSFNPNDAFYGLRLTYSYGIF